MVIALLFGVAVLTGHFGRSCQVRFRSPVGICWRFCRASASLRPCIYCTEDNMIDLWL